MTQAADVWYEVADETGVATVWIDCRDKKVNTLSLELMPQFEKVFDELQRDESVRAVVIASAKENGFIAGADIDDLNEVDTAAEGSALSVRGQQAMERLESLKVPTVAAIHGDCLGGGLELALSCTARVASSSPGTKLALPEVMLGLLPGAGGTQRLPKLVGLPVALDMMLTGKNIRAKKALKLGLVDQVVPQSQLTAAAHRLAGELAGGMVKPAPKKRIKDRVQAAFFSNPVGRAVAIRQARKMVLKQTKGLMPAPLKILDVVAAGTFAAEAAGFGELLVSRQSHGLRHLFRCITSLKKDDGPGTKDLELAPTRHVGVLGAGLMGAGIATVLSDRGVSVRLKDRSDEAVRSAIGHSEAHFAKARKRKIYGKEGFEERMQRLSGGTTYAGFGQAEVVIEAVFEDLELKRSLLAEVEERAKGRAIFATNTSSLPISEIASEAKHPERVIGMHFFSPVEKMPLVEVVVTDKTDPEVTARVTRLARRMGKHVIVVNDCAGFYTTRTLAPYMTEALYMALEGFDLAAIDEAAMSIGFPVGPITLMDEVGIDVGAKVIKVMKQHYADRMEFPSVDVIPEFLAEKRLGRKSGKGFYLYENGESKVVQGKKVVDPAVYRYLPKGMPTMPTDLENMGQRLILSLVNEAVWCLHDGTLREPMAGDLGAVMGIGFPPFEGGPFHYCDRCGVENIVTRMQTLATACGRRFEPCPLLLENAAAGKSFYSFSPTSNAPYKTPTVQSAAPNPES
jgi:3-hydroxyacyl-CoA dehydrogenase/enoyl-CoA hydratase/3-hydroxybutyryl-CoA epimerase